ncbi:DHH family phosphoesterase [Roseomonas nepalensis]|uniref:DHH family phosphoesterase n=1 Tax=Muricoccus nepalensis TaxID=1854500 RepID=A0A502GH56_9PROT|nr:DHH family phosphoesterase [Roseomonas nepalensis]TPG61121.1 DHH family phosphoesterase [Roseomonas nepalensis]
MAETEATGSGPDAAWIAARGAAFREALGRFDPAWPVLVLGHHDADGLSSSAILARALAQAGRRAEVRVLGRGENAWSEEMAAELRERAMGGLIVADLGTRAEPPLPGMPTILIDHHVPTGVPAEATLIGGHGLQPTPTTSLLAWWCGSAIGEAESLLWLAALGIIGDMEEGAGFAEMVAARARWGITALRNAASLVNAPRRASAGDAGPALALLMKADGPKAVLSGEHSETAVLRAAKEEVQQALAEGRRAAPRIRGEVAVIPLHSACQIHPLIAQQWKGRLRDKVVIAANTGYRPGWVHFAARAGTGTDLIRFFAEHRPEGADPVHYGNGHPQASGGALPPEAWDRFLAGLGFGAEAGLAAPAGGAD